MASFTTILIIPWVGYTAPFSAGEFDAHVILEHILTSQIITHVFLTLTMIGYVITVLLYLAKPYVIRILNQFSLRISFDLMWISYLTIRDLFLYSSFVFSLFIFIPYFQLGTETLVRWTYIIAIIMMAGVIGLRIFRDSEQEKIVVWITYTLLIVGLPFMAYSFYDLSIMGGIQ